MIARGAEANPSCFSASGLSDPIETVLPLYTRISMVVDNAFQNTKYCIYAMDLSASPYKSIPGTKQKRHQLKSDMSHLKDYNSLCSLLGIDYEECKKKEHTVQDVLPDLETKLKVENEEIREETEYELKRKLPSRELDGQNETTKEEVSEGGSSSAKENEPPVSGSTISSSSAISGTV